MWSPGEQRPVAVNMEVAVSRRQRSEGLGPVAPHNPFCLYLFYAHGMPVFTDTVVFNSETCTAVLQKGA